MSKSTCFECGVDFTRKKNLYTHLRKFHDFIHDRDPAPKRKRNELLCNICGKTFSVDSSLQRHIQTSHCYTLSDEQNSKCSRLICPYENCTVPFYRYMLLRKHLSSVHDIQVHLEELEFSSFTDFEKWKNKIQQETSSIYTLDCSAETLNDGKKKYFNCHHSYNVKSKGNDMKPLRYLRSNKIGKACPSRIEITYESDQNSTIFVKFWKTHHGHLLDVAHTSSEFTDTTRDEENDEEKSECIYVLNEQDLQNYACEHEFFPIKIITTNDDNMETDTEIEPLEMNMSVITKQAQCDEIKRKAEHILNLTDEASLNDEEIKSVVNKLDKIIDIFNKECIVDLETVQNININENVEKALHNYSTKKKSCLEEPSNHEKNVVADNPNESSGTLHIHTGSDHTYSK